MGSLAGVSLIGRTRPSSFVLARPPKRAERSPVRSYGRIKMTIIGPFQPQKDQKKGQKKKGIYVIQANSEWQRLSRHMHVGCEESQCQAAATRTLWSFAHPCQRAAVLRGTSDTYFPFFFFAFRFLGSSRAMAMGRRRKQMGRASCRGMRTHARASDTPCPWMLSFSP